MVKGALLAVTLVLGVVTEASGAGSAATAANFTTLQAATRGSYLSDGSSNGAAAGNSYVVGDCNRIDPRCPGGGPGPAEWRNWFRFDLSSVSGHVRAATLVLNVSSGFSSTTSPAATYELFDVAPANLAGLGTNSQAIWTDIGSGISYGSYVAFDTDSSGTTIAISLNAAGLAAINASLGSSFALGGAMTGLQGGSEVVLLFGGNTTTANHTELQLSFGAELTDQMFVPSPSTSGVALQRGVGYDCCAAQTFTAGVTGTLTAVDLLLLGQGNLQLSIYDTASGLPSSPLGSIPSASVTSSSEQFVHFTGFSVPVVAGHVYAIVAGWQGPGFSSLIWQGAVSQFAIYARGAAALRRGPAASWLSFGATDNGFRTYVIPLHRAPGDIDDDLKTDLVLYRPSAGYWFVSLSSTNYTAFAQYQWGVSTDIPVTGDYDGDGRTDLGLYRPSNGTWYVLLSSTNYTAFAQYQWGVSTDIPVTGDYDGDGRTDLGLYRPSTGYWYVLLSGGNYTTFVQYQWGLSTDVTVAGDYDGDGRTDLGLYRPSIGHWYILLSSTNYTSFAEYQWGLSTDITVAGDYDGDGRTDLGLYRPSSGSWYVLLSSSNYASYLTGTWGVSTDIPVSGDYDGDGKTDLGLYRPSNGYWYILLSSTNYTAFIAQPWGVSTDIPVVK
jgi:hypothetical protein